MTYEVIKEFWITLPDEHGDQGVAGYYAIHDSEPWQRHLEVGNQIDAEPEGEFSEEDITYLLKHGYVKEV